MRDIRGNEISMIFQEPMTSLNPVLTIGRQLRETLQLHEGLDRNAAEKRAVEMLTLVGIAEPQRRVREYPHQLSGGMRQRVMIAMALACNPKLLIADEPTTALDVTIQAQILDLMRDLKHRVGAAIILITHDLGVVAEVAERVMVMYAGRKVEEASVGDLFRTPRHPYTQGLLGAVPKLGSSVTGEESRLAEIPGLVPSLKQPHRRLRVREPLSSGDGFVPRGRAAARTQGAPATSRPATTRRAKRLRPHERAPRNQRSEEALPRRSRLPRSRPHGSMRSTASRSRLRAAKRWRWSAKAAAASRRSAARSCKLFDVTAGQVVLDGQRIDDLSPGALWPMRRRMQVVFQDPFSSLNPRMRVKDIVAEPIRNFGLATSAADLDARVAALLDRVRLPREAADRWPHEFSGGQRQRIGIARALAAEPDLIICDEAVSALDVSVKAQIINLLQDLQRELGLAMLFISHDLAIVEHMTHRVAVMYLGKIVEMAPKRAHLLCAEASLHAGAAIGRAGARPQREASAHHPEGRRAEPDQSAEGLPVSHALPVCVRSLPHRGAAAAACRRAARGGVSSDGQRAAGGILKFAARRAATAPRTPARAFPRTPARLPCDPRSCRSRSGAVPRDREARRACRSRPH